MSDTAIYSSVHMSLYTAIYSSVHMSESFGTI